MANKMTSECKECKELDLFSEKTSPSTYKISGKGWIILGTAGVAFGTFYAIATPFVLPALRKICLPYVPATTRQVHNVMQLLKSHPKSSGNSVIDLGSGDGRIVIEAAKRGFHATGVELNPWLVWYSKWKSWREGVHKSTSFTRTDLWKINLSTFDQIVIFGVEQMMPDLEKKINEELTDSGHVIACRFPLPSWKPVKTIDAGIDTVWLYKKQRPV